MKYPPEGESRRFFYLPMEVDIPDCADNSFETAWPIPDHATHIFTHV